MLTLRPYQREQHEAILRDQETGLNRLLVQSATGTGKTVMVSQLWSRLWPWMRKVRERPKAMVITHREEIIDQIAESFILENPELLVGVEQGDRLASMQCDVIVASIQTLSSRKYKRLQRFISRSDFQLVVVDEAHHAPAESYRGTLHRLGFLPSEELETPEVLKEWDDIALKDRLLLGVTATPNRSDAIGLECIFQKLSHSYPLRTAIRDGWLAPIMAWAIQTEASLDGVKMQRGDFNQRELSLAINREERNRLAVASWEKYAKGLPTIAFTVDVEHAQALADTFNRVGHRAVAVSGETDKDVRRSIKQTFERGDIDVVCNCAVYTEGTDMPWVSCILHARPTSSSTLYEQMTGRGLRLYKGKEHCIVIDMVDNCKRNTLQAAPQLYGLPPGIISNGTRVDEDAEAYEEMVEMFGGFGGEGLLQNGRRMTVDDIRVIAEKVDVWAIPNLPADVQKVSRLTWTPAGPNAFRIRYPWMGGYEQIDIRTDLMDKWEVSTRFTGPDAGVSPGIAGEFATKAEAIVVAEQFIRRDRPKVIKLRDREAAWRQGKPSLGQLSRLRELKVKFNKKLTMGQASDLIDYAMAKKSRRSYRSASGTTSSATALR